LSVPVSLSELPAEIEKFTRAPYLLTVSDDGRPHCVAIAVAWHDDDLAMRPGNRTLANSTARPSVSLVWSPDDPGGHSLIVDATVIAAVATDNFLTVRPTNAILHRPAVSA
jgi:hypothetical protein